MMGAAEEIGISSRSTLQFDAGALIETVALAEGAGVILNRVKCPPSSAATSHRRPSAITRNLRHRQPGASAQMRGSGSVSWIYDGLFDDN